MSFSFKYEKKKKKADCTSPTHVSLCCTRFSKQCMLDVSGFQQGSRASWIFYAIVLCELACLISLFSPFSASQKKKKTIAVLCWCWGQNMWMLFEEKSDQWFICVDYVKFEFLVQDFYTVTLNFMAKKIIFWCIWEIFIYRSECDLLGSCRLNLYQPTAASILCASQPAGYMEREQREN